MTYVSDTLVNEMLEACDDDMRDGKNDAAYEKANRVLELLDAGTLLSETPCVVVDKARAMKDRAELARLREAIDSNEPIDDIEVVWFATE
jgi:hypothetical protein